MSYNKLAHHPIKNNIYTKAPWSQNSVHLSLLCVVSWNVHTSSFYCTVHVCTIPWKVHTKNDIKQLTILSTFSFTFTIGFGLGVLQSPPLIYALSSLHYVHIYNQNFKKSSKICGHYACIESSCSQVASSRPYQVHWTFTSLMDRFQSCLIIRFRIHTERTWKVPSCPT
jgi:hypothetical protein